MALITGLRYIRSDTGGGVRIGALTRLSDIVESTMLARQYQGLKAQRMRA